MRIIERNILYELTPEEYASDELERIIMNALEEMNNQERVGAWSCRSYTRKGRMKFDANYNRYYATAKYELTP